MQFTGLLGITAIFVTAYLMSNDRKIVNWRLIICGISLQMILAVFVLRTPIGQALFRVLGVGVKKLLEFADAGAIFVFGPLAESTALTGAFGAETTFIFALKLVPTIIFVAALASFAYHVGLMQRVVNAIALVVYKVMGASGSEATSNAASVLVGQVEAQILIKPYLASATRSELLAMMAGSMACISGAIMAVYIQMGISASYLMTASVMAIPGALVLAKIIHPETEDSPTRGSIKLKVERTSVNAIDALAHGAIDGLRVGAVVCATLIAALAVIALIDYLLGGLGRVLIAWFYDDAATAVLVGLDLNELSLSTMLGAMFRYVAMLMGVPAVEATTVGGLMGTKIIVNEFVAYSQLAPQLADASLSPKSEIIATFALCGFANLGSVAMLIGGLGQLAPERKHDLAKLGIRAMICGTLASYLSASIAGILHTDSQNSGDASLIMPLVMIALCVLVIVLVNYVQSHSGKIQSLYR